MFFTRSIGTLLANVFAPVLVNIPRDSPEGDKLIFQKHREIAEGDKFPTKGTRFREGSGARGRGSGNLWLASVRSDRQRVPVALTRGLSISPIVPKSLSPAFKLSKNVPLPYRRR
jgi:hypothetical protein